MNIKSLANYLNDLEQTMPGFEVFEIIHTGDADYAYVHVVSYKREHKVPRDGGDTNLMRLA